MHEYRNLTLHDCSIRIVTYDHKQNQREGLTVPRDLYKTEKGGLGTYSFQRGSFDLKICNSDIIQ